MNQLMKLSRVVLLISLLSSCFSKENDSSYIKRLTRIDVNAFKQIERKETDFYLKCKYAITDSEEFLKANKDTFVECESVSYCFDDTSEICFGEMGSYDWCATLDSNTSILSIKIWFPDFSGDQ